MPCMCGDPVCPSCFPGAREAEEALERDTTDTLHQLEARKEALAKRWERARAMLSTARNFVIGLEAAELDAYEDYAAACDALDARKGQGEEQSPPEPPDTALVNHLRAMAKGFADLAAQERNLTP